MAKLGFDISTIHIITLKTEVLDPNLFKYMNWNLHAIVTINVNVKITCDFYKTQKKLSNHLTFLSNSIKNHIRFLRSILTTLITLDLNL